MSRLIVYLSCVFRNRESHPDNVILPAMFPPEVSAPSVPNDIQLPELDRRSREHVSTLTSARAYSLGLISSSLIPSYILSWCAYCIHSGGQKCSSCHRLEKFVALSQVRHVSRCAWMTCLIRYLPGVDGQYVLTSRSKSNIIVMTTLGC